MAKNNGEALDNAAEVIERFGGIRPMSSKTDIPVTTIQGWKTRNSIPANRTDEILRAAKENDVDLSGLAGSGANENAIQKETLAPQSASPDVVTQQPVQGDVQTTEDEKTPAFLGQHDEQAAQKEEQEFAAALADVEKKAVGKSAFVTILVLLVVLGGVAYFAWPHYQALTTRTSSMEAVEQDIEQLEAQVGAVRSDVETMKEQQGFLRGMIPDGWEGEFDSLRAQTETLRAQGAQLQQQAQAALEKASEVSADVFGAEAGTMDARLEALAAHMRELGASEAMTGMVTKMKAMQSTMPGRDVLDQAMNELGAVMQVMPEESAAAGAEGAQAGGFDVNAMLDQARQNSNVLGETFEGVPQEQMKAAALLFTMNQFRAALNRDNEAFGNDLAVLKQLVGDEDPALNAALDELAPHAQSGVLTVEGLSGEFRSLAGDAVVASLRGEDVSIQEKAKARMNEIFSVERNGELVTGTETQAKIAKTEQLLQQGDLEKAVAEVETLDPQVKEALSPWLNKAKVTLMAQQAKQQLNTLVSGGGLGSIGGEFISYPEYDMYIYKPGPKLPKMGSMPGAQ